MRLLIAGGGTGGHTPGPRRGAARSPDRPNAPDLDWLGGHRGLEAGLVRAAGIPVRRLVLRSLRSVEDERPRGPRPDPARGSVPQAGAIGSPASDRRRSSRPAATSRCRR